MKKQMKAFNKTMDALRTMGRMTSKMSHAMHLMDTAIQLTDEWTSSYVQQTLDEEQAKALHDLDFMTDEEYAEITNKIRVITKSDGTKSIIEYTRGYDNIIETGTPNDNIIESGFSVELKPLVINCPEEDQLLNNIEAFENLDES